MLRLPVEQRLTVDTSAYVAALADLLAGDDDSPQPGGGVCQVLEMSSRSTRLMTLATSRASPG